MIKLTLGTAQIIENSKGSIFLRYMSHGNFTVGERFYSNEQAAREFCADRDLRVLR